MKKPLSMLMSTALALSTVSAMFANAEESEHIYTFNEYMSMTDEEYAEISHFSALDELNFGNDDIDDEVKFEAYLNTPPPYWMGDYYESTQWYGRSVFISGESKPYISYYVNEDKELLSDIKADKFGLPSDWKVNSTDGAWILGGEITGKIHEYRVEVPISVFQDFETYIRFTEAVNSSYMVTDTALGVYGNSDVYTQFASLGGQIAVIFGDVNLDTEINVADCTYITQYLAAPDEYLLSDDQKIAADVTGSGDGITAADALAIQRYLAGETDTLG